MAMCGGLPRWRVIKKIAVFFISAAVTCTFIINFCALIYNCGCHSFWADAADHCNIHMADMHHCPWCSIGTEGFAAVVAGIVALQATISFARLPIGIAARLVSSLI